MHEFLLLPFGICDGGGILSNVRIPRPQKDLMRQKLETIIALQKEINQKIEVFRQETEIEEYQRFWTTLKTKNEENIQTVASYMVRKCNR